MDRKLIERVRAELEEVRRQAVKKRDEADRVIAQAIRLQRRTTALIEQEMAGQPRC
jgi:hypothetical protein